MRQETRENIFYREDFPAPDNENWLKWILVEKGKHEVFLLYGVTASGKTEVYMQAIGNYVNGTQFLSQLHGLSSPTIRIRVILLVVERFAKVSQQHQFAPAIPHEASQAQALLISFFRSRIVMV
jgi:late competence protein required for DNA uptake (superfamily II DNA/RNA helicase)